MSDPFNKEYTESILVKIW